MKKTERTEFIANCIVTVLSIAFAVFIVGYEYYAMGQYSKDLVQEDRTGFGIASMVLFLFFFLPAAVGMGVFALLLFTVTLGMYRADGKRKADFIADKTRAAKTKNRCLIALIVFKAIATAFALLLVFFAFGAAYETALSKTAYCAAFAIYAVSLVLTIVNRKKIKAQAANLLHTENNL